MANNIFQPGSISITSPTGNELVSVNNGPVWTHMTTQQIANLAGQSSSTGKASALNTVGNGSLTAAIITGRFVIRGGSQSSTPFTDTTVSGPTIIAALPAGAPVGTSFGFDYVNTTNAEATISAGSGVTINSGITPTATVTVPANGYANFLVVVSTSSTVTMTQVGLGNYGQDSADTTKVVGFQPSGQATATTATIATNNQANATYTLPPATSQIAGTTAGGLYLPDVYRSASTTSLTNATPGAINGMSTLALVNGTYKFHAYIGSTANGTSGIQVTFTLTTAVLSSMEATGKGFAAAALVTQHTATATSGTALFASTTASIDVDIDGTFVVTTPGSITFNAALNTGSTSAVVNAGSYVEITRIA